MNRVKVDAIKTSVVCVTGKNNESDFIFEKNRQRNEEKKNSAKEIFFNRKQKKIWGGKFDEGWGLHGVGSIKLLDKWVSSEWLVKTDISLE